MNTTRKFLLALIAVLASLAVPAAAQGATFCVHSPSNCGGGTVEPNLQSALDDADNNGVNTKDTIRIGVGLFNDGPAVDVAGNPVDIIGEAANKTAIRTSSTMAGVTILDIQEPTSQITSLRVHHNSAAPTATGIKLRGDADDILVTNQSFAGQFDGIQPQGSGVTIDESSVSLVYPTNLQNRAIFVPTGASPTITDTYLEGTVGVATSSSSPTVRRTRINATQGVVSSSGSSTVVSDTEIRTPGPMDSGFQKVALAVAGNGTTSLDVDRVTAYSTDASAYGLWSVPNGGAGNDASTDLQGSAFKGYGIDLRVAEGGGSSSTVNTSWSAYDFSSISLSGSPTITQAANNFNLHNVDPKFVSAANGNLRLAYNSPLIDKGNPAFQPFLGGLDVFKRTRVVDGNGAGGPVVDMGAHEYQHKAPLASALATPQTVGTGEPVTFDASQSSDPDQDPITFQWTFDDGAQATGVNVQHAFADGGQHTATVTVTDATGLTATANATVDVQAPAAPAAPDTPGGGTQTPTALSLDGLKFDPATFRAKQSRRHSAKSTAAKRAPVGTKIRFRLSEAAQMTFTIDRARPGRKVGKSCVKPTRKNKSKPKCVRWKKVGSFTGTGKAGSNTRKFDGRLKGKPLAPGKYRLRLRGRTTAGVLSLSKTKKFTIVR